MAGTTRPLRIAMVVHSDPVFDGRVKKEARTLVAAGHEVTVFGTLPPGRAATGAADLGFEVVYPKLPSWVTASGVLPTLRRSARWFERMAPLVDEAMRRGPPDVLHAHDLDTVGPASRAALAAGIACVYDDHEASYADKLPNYVPADLRGARRAALDAIARHLKRRGLRLEREVRRRGLAAVITVSDACAARIEERFGGPAPLVLRNCPAFREVPRTDALRERLGLARGARIVLYHGSATEGSGLDVVIRALRHLPPECVFVVLGRVWRQERYEAIAREEGVADRVRFVPPVPEDQMFRLVASADVGVVPTEPNSEGNLHGIPNKLYESMTSGLPVVCSDTPGVKAVVERTGAGLTYPAAMPQDPAALAAAVRRLIEDAALRQRCREGGLRIAREELNWEIEGRRLVELYDLVVSDVARRRGAR